MKGFIGSANIDTNSRLCMASTVAGHVRAFGADVVPGTYEDLELADLVVLVGSNLAWCHPVLFQRLQAARAARGTRLVVIDPRRTATCEGADLHLPLAPGSDVALFAGLLDHLRPRPARSITTGPRQHTTGLEEALAGRAWGRRRRASPASTPADIARFYAWFAATPRTVTVFSQGVNQSSSGTDKVNSHPQRPPRDRPRSASPAPARSSVTGQPNAMGGREVGGLANQLAAHMRFDQPGAADRVRRFWNAPAHPARPRPEGGRHVRGGGRRPDQGDLDHVHQPGRQHAPRRAASAPRCAACPFVVVSDIWPTDTTRLAHVVLPAAGWGERSGTVTNSERRISRQRAFRDPPGEARPDWWALAQVGQRMGWRRGVRLAQPRPPMFREHAALTAFENDGTRLLDLGGARGALAMTRYDDARRRCSGQLPSVRRPADACSPTGGFATADGRARFVPTVWRPPASRRDARFPLLLNTGRVRDQWHTMTRTGLVPRLMQHVAEPLVALHRSRRGRARHRGSRPGPARDRARQRRAARRARPRPAPGRGVRADALGPTLSPLPAPSPAWSAPRRDPVSGQPELKATPVRAAPVATAWRGLLLHVRAVVPQGAVWSRVPLADGHAFDLAGTEPLPQPMQRIRPAMMEADGDRDPRTGRPGARHLALCRAAGRAGAGLPLSRPARRTGCPRGEALSTLLAATGRRCEPRCDAGRRRRQPPRRATGWSAPASPSASGRCAPRSPSSKPDQRGRDRPRAAGRHELRLLHAGTAGDVARRGGGGLNRHPS